MNRTSAIVICIASTSLFALAACGSQPSSAAQPGTVTVTQTVTLEPTPDESTITEEPVDPPTDSTETDVAPSGTPTLSAGQGLTLESFFSPSPLWTENRFDVADRSQVRGISREISECRDEYTRLEMRLSNKFKQLKFSAAQDNNSTSSEQVLEVSVFLNGTAADVRRIPFNTVQDFDIDVTGVNALQLGFAKSRRGGFCENERLRVVVFDGTLS